MDFLKDMGINCFPVVYTTADPAHVHPTSMHANGVYFSAGDLFAFVQKLGPLRLNILKPCKEVKKDYPWLDFGIIPDQAASYRGADMGWTQAPQDPL